MGILRTLIAITVVLNHSYVNMFVDGRNAVQLFYMISGFLISYVLVESKNYPKLKDFYINRYLRLYPIYFAVALITLIENFIIGNPSFFDVYKNAPLSADFLLVLSNMFLFGQDWIMFSGVEHNSLVFTQHFQESPVLLYHGLIVRQAWTLGVELSFYLVAPFILPKRNIIYVLLALSIALRIYIYSIGLGAKDPWTYRFFPAELALFLLGTLAHQILLPRYKKICITFFYFMIPLKVLIKTAMLFVIFLTLMPFAFVFQNKNRIDKWIGNLSYPIYVGHLFVITTVTYIASKIGMDNRAILAITSVLLSILFAMFLNSVIGAPFEKIRNKFRHADSPIQPQRRQN